MTPSFESPEWEGTTGSVVSVAGQSSQPIAGTRGVAVLSTRASKETTASLNAVRVLKHEPLWIHTENVTSWTEDGSVRFSPLVDIDRCRNSWWGSTTVGTRLTFPSATPMNRRTTLEHLARITDAEREETTTIDTLVAALDTDRRAVEVHLAGLEACELVRIDPDGTARVTVTGEEFLQLDTEEAIIVDSGPPCSEK